MAKNIFGLTRGKEYTRYYGSFRGLNLSGDNASIGDDEFVYLENMYRDYGSGLTGPETFPGYRVLYRFGVPIRGIYSFPFNGEEGAIVYAGDALYRFAFAERDALTALSPVLTGLSGAKGTAFCFRGDFYLIDGVGFYRVTADGEASRVTDAPYIPVVSLNGSAYEQRNLLTDQAIERTVIGDASELFTVNGGLRFAVNEDGVTARVVSYSGEDDCLTIPETVTIGGKDYPVTVIGENSCASKVFRMLCLPEGLRTVEKSAFRNCRALESLVLPSTVTELGIGAFLNCTALSYIYVGEEMAAIRCAFGGCTGVKTVAYALSAEELSRIEDEVSGDDTPSSFAELCAGATVLYGVEMPKTKKGGVYRIPLSEPLKSFFSVTLDGTRISSGGTPLFSPCAEELFPYSAAMAAIRNRQIPFLSFSTYEKSFAVWGTADTNAEIYLGSITASDGVYRLSGTPSGGSTERYYLRVEYVTAAGETCSLYDVGSGVLLPDVAVGSELCLYFGTKSGTAFSGNVFEPSLVAATDSIRLSSEISIKDGKRVLSAVLLSVTDESLLDTATIDVHGRLMDRDQSFSLETGLLPNEAAILCCSLSAVYDGRVFLSGNPDAPSVTFYPARNREGVVDLSYFGIYNYFIDGKATTGNAALLSTASGLFVLKGEPDGVGSVYCRVGADTQDDLVPRIYPLAASCDGETPVGAATVFEGRVVFLSKRGLFAVGRESLESERRLYEVSRTVERRLSEWEGAKTSATVFDGYLLLSDGEGNCFLADSRSSSLGGYVFYALSGIGSYSGDVPAYEYAFSLPEGADGYTVSAEKCGTLCEGDVKKSGDLYYTDEEGARVLVSYRGERRGGVFSPARVFGTVSDTVLFGTEDGTLSLFNTDMRGEDGLFPPTAYSFAGHRYRSGCALRRDDAGVPQLLKDTVRRSAVLKTKNFRGGRLNVLLRVDTEPLVPIDVLRGGEADFGEIDFDAFSFADGTSSVHPFRDASRRYAEKQYYFYTEDYKARFGLCDVSFRFKIGGNIR